MFSTCKVFLMIGQIPSSVACHSMDSHDTEISRSRAKNGQDNSIPRDKAHFINNLSLQVTHWDYGYCHREHQMHGFMVASTPHVCLLNEDQATLSNFSLLMMYGNSCQQYLIYSHMQYQNLPSSDIKSTPFCYV